jgi:hypothetical protein
MNPIIAIQMKGFLCYFISIVMLQLRLKGSAWEEWKGKENKNYCKIMVKPGLRIFGNACYISLNFVKLRFQVIKDL